MYNYSVDNSLKLNLDEIQEIRNLRTKNVKTNIFETYMEVSLTYIGTLSTVQTSHYAKGHSTSKSPYHNVNCIH